MTRKKEPSLADIICHVDRTSKTWFDMLPPEHKATALEVKEMVRAKGLARETVARNMVASLGLTVKPQAVSKWLKESKDS